MSRYAAWRVGLPWVMAVACSSTDNSHPPGVNTDCTKDCDKGGSMSGSGSNPTPQTDAGAAPDGRATVTACGTDCVTDPNFGLSLCSRSVACPGVFVDRTNPALQNCGFIDLRGGCDVANVQCLCGAFLCPISTAANCSTLSGLLSQQTDICGPAIASNSCRALNTTANRDAGRCDTDCLRACGNAPACFGLCC